MIEREVHTTKGENQRDGSPVSISQLREKLYSENGSWQWTGLEEISESDKFKELLNREFPRQTAPWMAGMDRREFMKLMGASLALAGLAACRQQPIDKIVPYVKQPESIVPGFPLFYASTLTLNGYGVGVLVETHEGRPTKIEGNPDHPASLGSTDAFLQAMVLGLYDPDRSQMILNAGNPATWDNFLLAANNALRKQMAFRGTGVRILTEAVTSPSLAKKIRDFLAMYPEAKWHTYEPINTDNARQGAIAAFGRFVQTKVNFDRADVILSIGSDFLFTGPARIRYARDFADRRRVRKTDSSAQMNRLYTIESVPTLTGAMADHLLTARPYDVQQIAMAIGNKLGVSNDSTTIADEDWVDALVTDLNNHRGKCVVVVGDDQPPYIHALAHAINMSLGNNGNTIEYIEPVEQNPVSNTESLVQLVQDMQDGKVDFLLTMGGNPAYNAPADIPFFEAVKKVDFTVRLGLYFDETSLCVKWHIPMAHELESWGDAKCYDGTVSVIQPMIEPLLGGRTAYEVLSSIMGQPETDYDAVKGFWQQQLGSENFESRWRNILHEGFIPDTSSPSVEVNLQETWKTATRAGDPGSGYQIVFRPDPTLWDGRFANLSWLQELPKPLTKMTWDNVIAISPKTAEQLGIGVNVSSDGEKSNKANWIGKGFDVRLAELEFAGRKIKGPVWIQPGHPDQCVSVTLGYGRSLGGEVCKDVGFNAYHLRTSDHLWFGAGAKLTLTNELYDLATTQSHYRMEDRHIVRMGTIKEYLNDSEFAQKMGHHVAEHDSMYPKREDIAESWAMVIDSNVCIACNACVVACQAENNIPTVGKHEVLRGREMHWIRIDRYYSGGIDHPETLHLPVTCMHCEKAPCEVVCPVAATTHSHDGLNMMIYNRCVGTRYCSNNCPYKVRRFNFLQYTDNDTPILKLLNNPNVTVRGRGVMEKCSYCVQRISAARIAAKKENRAIRDGEVVTACQSACPTKAIVFGNLLDKQSHVSLLKEEPTNYAVLEDLNTKPRTTYLAKLRNPNPQLGPSGGNRNGH